MLDDNINILQDEDEDVIIEGSDLHQALIDMGLHNFDTVPKVKADISVDTEFSAIVDHQSSDSSLIKKFSCMYNHFFHDSQFSKKQLSTILQADIILDDHATTINELYNDLKLKEGALQWFPIIGSLITATLSCAVIRRQTFTIAAVSFVSSLYIYQKFKSWIAARNLKHLVILQNELHELCKRSLKILRRTWAKKSVVTKIHEKQELIGTQKWDIIIAIMQFLAEIFSNLSKIYYKYADDLLRSLPDCSHMNCILTNLEKEGNSESVINYNDLKSLYYTYILVQSELMVILANAYSGRHKNVTFSIPKTELSTVFKNLKRELSPYHFKLTKLLQQYEQCDMKPVRRVFRGLPNSKWQDTYIHLELTSHRIQLAYQEITAILEYMDINSEKNEDNFQFIESITEKMNEAYKQIENARSFAEFSSLLIAKAQRKPIEDRDTENQSENLFPTTESNSVVMSFDDELKIEDEVFEEYIKEEYLKPLYESSEGVMENYKLDKLLKKNFMSELKEALIDKQKTMTEREIKALKRMYDKIQKDSNLINTDPEKCEEVKKHSAPPQIINTSQQTLLPQPLPREPLLSSPPPPPPPPLPPPRPLVQKVIAENDVTEVEQKVERHPVPLPRFKMLQPEDEIPDVQRFSLKACTPSFKFPTNFKLEEETFLGSGENSEIEDESENDECKSDEGVEN